MESPSLINNGSQEILDYAPLPSQECDESHDERCAPACPWKEQDRRRREVDHEEAGGVAGVGGGDGGLVDALTGADIVHKLNDLVLQLDLRNRGEEGGRAALLWDARRQ